MYGEKLIGRVQTFSIDWKHLCARKLFWKLGAVESLLRIGKASGECENVGSQVYEEEE